MRKEAVFGDRDGSCLSVRLGSSRNVSFLEDSGSGAVENAYAISHALKSKLSCILRLSPVCVQVFRSSISQRLQRWLSILNSEKGFPHYTKYYEYQNMVRLW